MNSLKKWESILRDKTQKVSVTPPEDAWDIISSSIDNTDVKGRRTFLIPFIIIGTLMAGAALIWVTNGDNNILILEPHNMESSQSTTINPNTLDQAGTITFPASEATSGETSSTTSGNFVAGWNEKASSGVLIDKSNNNDMTSDEVPQIAMSQNVHQATLKNEPPANDNSKNVDIFKIIDDYSAPVFADPLRTVEANQIERDIYNNDIKLSASKYLPFLKDLPIIQPHTPVSLSGNASLIDYRPPGFSTIRHKRWSPYIEVYAGMGYPLRQMTLSGEPNSLLSYRQQTEKPWYTTQASMTAGISLHKIWTASIGLEYALVKEKFDYLRSGITKIVIDFEPQTGLAKDTNIISGTIINSGENKFQMYTIPVLLGYQKQLNQNWMLAVEAGAAFNFYTTITGKVLYSDQDVRRIDDIPEMYHRNLGISVRGGLVLQYLWNDNLSLFVSPKATFYLDDWSHISNPVRSKYNLINVGIGLRKSF